MMIAVRKLGREISAAVKSVIVLSVMASMATACTSPATTSKPPRSPIAAAIDQYAFDAAAANGDPHVASVTWVATNRTTANAVISGAGVGGSTVLVYAIEVPGHFTPNVSVPRGSREPSGRFLTLVVTRATFLTTDFGVQNRPANLARLGKPETDSLVGYHSMTGAAWSAKYNIPSGADVLKVTGTPVGKAFSCYNLHSGFTFASGHRLILPGGLTVGVSAFTSARFSAYQGDFFQGVLRPQFGGCIAGVQIRREVRPVVGILFRPSPPRRVVDAVAAYLRLPKWRFLFTSVTEPRDR